MSLLARLKHHFWTREFLLFLVVGTFNTLDSTVIAKAIIFLDVDANLSFNIAYLAANVVAYLLNCYFIFHERPQLLVYVRFFISYIPNYIVQNIIVFVCMNLLGIMDVVSFLTAAVLGVPITFLFVKIFAFGRS